MKNIKKCSQESLVAITLIIKGGSKSMVVERQLSSYSCKYALIRLSFIHAPESMVVERQLSSYSCKYALIRLSYM